MNREEALNIAIGCVMSSAMDMETKREVIDLLRSPWHTGIPPSDGTLIPFLAIVDNELGLLVWDPDADGQYHGCYVDGRVACDAEEISAWMPIPKEDV